MPIPNTSTIREWPVDDRPREKLFRLGEQKLANSELLAILLGTGIKGVSAVDLGRQILTRFKTFRNMSHVDPCEWEALKGLGQAKIARIRAALEIGRRFREDELKLTRIKLRSAKDLVNILMPQMRDLKTEIFKVAYLNNQNEIIEVVDICEGTVNRASPFIREIFKKALSCFSASVICCHNHPSGNPTPSREDQHFTQELVEAGKILGVKVVDHIIIGDNDFYSFREQNHPTCT